MLKIFLTSLSCVAFCCVAPAQAPTGKTPPPAAGLEPTWTPLFDGKTLDGFVKRGGKARYEAVNNTIVGHCVPSTPNTFLCTERDYGDFELTYEFHVDGRLNSGVQIRSQSLPSYRRGRVHGYQVEIDPDVKRNRMWSGGIYDEARRGWIGDLSKNKAAREAFRPEQWNRIRVFAVGDSIRTWINGVPAADLVDSMTLSGFIGLQVHGVGKNKTPMKVQWRDLRIRDLGRHVWKPIFDGKSLAGWTPNHGKWTVKDGILHGANSAADAHHGLLVFDRPMKDATIRLKFRATAGNSGLYFRAEPKPGGLGIHGMQAEIDASKDVGGLYETGGRGWVVRPKPKAVAKYFKPGKWNELTVSAHGPRIVVHVNGRQTAEIRQDTGRTGGRIALQVHGKQDVDVAFKDIEMLVKAPR